VITARLAQTGEMKMARPVVAIVGRPNVGKSTLFNRLLGERVTIVENSPGITRDRVYGHTDWRGREFTVIDTGGLGMADDDPFGQHIQQQAELAMEEADVVLFLVDSSTGLTAGDEEVAAVFRRAGRPIILVANKADNPRREADSHEHYRLGLGEVFTISSNSGRGVGDLLDEVVRLLPGETSEPEDDEDRLKVAIVGRPNVGKSSLLNAILGQERVIVSPVAGTTRDAVDVPFEYGESKFTLIDTAGIRRAGKIQGSVEFYTVLRAERAIERADVGVLVVDAAYGVVDGDKRVAGLLRTAGRGCVVFVNKWDLVQGRTPREFGEVVRREMPFLSWASIIVGSAEKGRGLDHLLEACSDAANNHALRLATPELNHVIHEAIDRRPYSSRGREFKVYYATQVSVKPPTFVLFVNDPKIVHETYMRYLENQLRASFGFAGTPIRVLTRKRAREEAA
jgi:GTP-binding protein